MSTRSGRRIHGSFHEPEVPAYDEPTAKSVKKTHSKRGKDNIEVVEATVTKSKKRKNYVTYPSDEESQGVPEVPKQSEQEPVRLLRKNTLKEQNLNITSTESIEVVDSKKPVRVTRRTKKFVENHEEDVDQNVEKEVTDSVANGGKPKGKKNKKSKSDIPDENEVALVPKKKNKQKKKKSNGENNIEVQNSTLNHTNTSIDSFHSAAGSPVNVDGASNDLNTTFDKSPEKVQETDKNVSKNNSSTRTSDRKKRMSAINSEMAVNDNILVTQPNPKTALRQNSTFEVIEIEQANTEVAAKVNTPNKRLTKQNSTFEVIEVETTNVSITKGNTTNQTRVSRQNTFEMTEVVNVNTTFEKEKEMSRRSSIKNSTFDPDSSPLKQSRGNSTFDKNKSGSPDKLNTTFEKENRTKSLHLSVGPEKLPMNGTFGKKDKLSDAMNTTFDKETKLDSTFDKEKSCSNKSSLVTSDDTNLTYDKSYERISITSDDSRIGNTTPVLIESSMDESHINTSQSKTPKVTVQTPMKREGTFTKDSSDIEPKTFIESVRTPTKRLSLATPGSTPFPFSKSGQKEKAMLNVTRSIEKSRLSFMDAAPSTRTTKVMFCSPVNNPVVVAQQKKKVIKSNLKGSNKSFVFEETAPSPVRAAPRKRSYTHNDVDEARAKRFRCDDQQQSVHRLSRPRTSTAKPEQTTPSKRIPTPSKSKSESKVSRTKLPNFAALHQKRFEKMESLDECQERKAKRAKQLLTPSAAINVLERSSPRGSEQGKAKEAMKKPDGKDKLQSNTEKAKERRSESKPRPEPTRKIDRRPEIEKKATRSIAKVVRTEDNPQKREVQKDLRSNAKVVRPEDLVTSSEVKETRSTKVAKPEEQPQKVGTKPLPTLDNLQRGYTRFGFKMNIGVNPFSVPSNVRPKVKEVAKTKNGLARQVMQPSLAGATVSRQEAAKLLVMREKSSSSARRDHTRGESRTHIKGVRTNRRFELQMQMRNIS